MKVCIVGGTGNISSSFIPLLLYQGHEVTCFNRGKTGTLPKDVRVIQGDRSNRDEFEKTMQREQFDAAIDMICFTREEALSSFRAFKNVGHFVHCSTVCTYGVQYDYYPADEIHPLRPVSDYGRNKVHADNAFLAAYHGENFPVTIIKPSTTYGDKMGLLRQIAWEFSWIDRVRKGKPIVVCGDGNALHQFLHVDDAALCFVNILGKQHTIGQTYNMTRREYTTWAQWHRVAMKVIGREVELIGVPYEDLAAMKIPDFSICESIFAHHIYYSAEKLFRAVPEFRPRISLEEGIGRVLEAMDRAGRVPDSDKTTWEDRIVEAQKKVRSIKIS